MVYIFHTRANKERDGLIPVTLNQALLYGPRPVRSVACSTERAS